MKKAMVNKIQAECTMKKGKNSQFGKIIPYMVFTKNVGAGAGVKTKEPKNWRAQLLLKVHAR